MPHRHSGGVGFQLKALRRRPLGCRSRALLRLAILLAVACGSVDAERLPVRTYSTDNGLAHNTITRIVRDSQGFLWFCTPNGLSRFDGYVFRTFGSEYGLPATAVNDLLETSDGDYWLATDDGLLHLDRWKRSSGPLPTQAEPANAPLTLGLIVPGDRDPRSRAITVLRRTRSGTVWVGTRNGLFRLSVADAPSLEPVDIGLATDFPEQRIIVDVVEDRHGTLWIGTPVGLYRRWADGRTEHYTTSDPLVGQYVSDLLEDHDGFLWVATREAGIFRLRIEAGHVRPVTDVSLTTTDGLPSDWVAQLFETSDHRFWAATARGLAELVPHGSADPRRVRPYLEQQGIGDHFLGALAEDLAGNLWIGSSEAGAFKLSQHGFTTFSSSDGIESVYDVFEDAAGTLCFRGLVPGDAPRVPAPRANRDQLTVAASDKIDGFGCLSRNRFTLFRPVAVKRWGWVREAVTLRARNGEWWIGSEGGVIRYPPSDQFADVEHARPLAVYRTEDGLPAIQTFRLFEDSTGDVWISSISSPTRGLSLFDRRSGTLRDVGRLSGLPSPVVDLARSFAEDRSGNVWIAFNSGLARYKNGAVSFFGPRDGLPAGPILDMRVDRSGRLWLASERGGLVRIDAPSASQPAFTTYTTANGLSSNSLTAIVEDLNGYLYVGGGNGVDRIDTVTGRVRHFTEADGLNPAVVKSAFRDRHGVLWFGMSNGLARLDPAPEKSANAPPILISSIRIAGVRYRVSPFGESRISLAALPPDDHQLEIEFVGLGFGPGEVLGYQYRLEGKSDWSSLSPRRTVTYASLSPGAYTVSVRAVNADGAPSPSPATVTFMVLAPFWQRWWFIGTLALTIGITGTLAYRYRVARLLEVANMRTRIATDLHDDIGANLTRIALLSEVAQRTREQAPLVSIANVARESVSAMSDIVWAINPRREGLLDLTRRMRQHASELFTLRGIALRFDAPAGAETQRLGIDVRRDVLLIFKEAVNNAARHSRCTAVHIAIRVERGTLVLAVVDDGVGLDPSQEVDGQGLASMRRRALRMKGSVAFEPVKPSGTAVILKVPIRA
jgi:ligand-binding sensor domain-containing protein/two-component sensor histidine kinase